MIKPHKLFLFLILADLLVLILSLAQINQGFSTLEDQGHIPLFSFIQLLFLATAAWDMFHSKGRSPLWISMCLGAMYLSLNEAATIHKQIANLLFVPVEKSIALMSSDFIVTRNLFLSDNIYAIVDALMIAGYIAIVFYVIFAYRSELFKYTESLHYFFFSLVFIAITILFQYIEPAYGVELYNFNVLLEGHRLIAESLMIAFVVSCNQYGERAS